MIHVENISKKYVRKHGSVFALDNVSLDIKQGEFVTIVGPSGSGKSTLLLALGGMNKPCEGSVQFEKNSIYNWKLKERAAWRAKEIGFVFQSFNLIPYLSVYENIAAGLTLSGVEEISEEMILPIMEQLKIAERREHLPSELSVGQQQRVALARALVKDPSIILADEPTGNLDPETSKEVMDYLIDQHSKGKTVIIITHDPNIADMGERTIRIEDGKIV